VRETNRLFGWLAGWAGAGTVFFSHNNPAGTVFWLIFQASRTAWSIFQLVLWELLGNLNVLLPLAMASYFFSEFTLILLACLQVCCTRVCYDGTLACKK